MNISIDAVIQRIAIEGAPGAGRTFSLTDYEREDGTRFTGPLLFGSVEAAQFSIDEDVVEEEWEGETPTVVRLLPTGSLCDEAGFDLLKPLALQIGVDAQTLRDDMAKLYMIELGREASLYSEYDGDNGPGL